MSDYYLTPGFDETQEIWKPIPNYLGYEASNHGNIRSYWQGCGKGCRLENIPHLLKQSLSIPPKTQYYFVDVGYGNHKPVHRLVLTAFIGICPDKHEACHNDGNPLNNHISNLRWDTRRNNALDRIKHGSIKSFGENHPKAKLTNKDVIDIRQGVYSHLTILQISIRFNMSTRCIRDVINRISWKHLP